MEYLSIFFAVLGALLVSWGGIRYLVKPGLIAKFSLRKHDSGDAKIPDITYSACYIVSGFLLFLLSTLTSLYNKSSILLYIFTVITFITACGYLLLYAPKQIIKREKTYINSHAKSKERL